MPRELIQNYILYKVDRFDEQYANLFEQFSDSIVVREKNFHDDFMSLFERIDTRYILFGTDDVVYYDSVDVNVINNAFEMFPQDVFGFSLRLSPGLLRDQGESVTALKVAGEGVFRIDWRRAHSRMGGYPFELNSSIYKTSLVRRILGPVAKDHPTLNRMFRRESFRVKLLGSFFHMKSFLAGLDTFRDPNTLEGHCYRWCKTHRRRLPRYLYFQKLCASAIQINRVNTTIDNPTDGLCEHTVEALNEKYKRGYRFDIKYLEEKKPVTVHVGRKYFKLARDSSESY
jgi:hypothetical protein